MSNASPPDACTRVGGPPRPPTRIFPLCARAASRAKMSPFLRNPLALFFLARSGDGRLWQKRGSEVSDEDENLTCPHCKGRLSKWESPPSSTWGIEFQFVCFNDECPYFVRGWKWMWEHYNVHASYRYRYNPATGEKGPLPVWSQDAMKSNIVGGDEKEQNRNCDQWTASTD